MERSQPIRLDSLTSMRFLAALLVVLSHSTRDLAEVPILTDLAAVGTVGVGFFFALSGFVLMWSHREGDTARRFYRRRFARVYPMHLLTYVLAFPVLLLAGENMSGATVNLRAAIVSPALLQAWFPADAVRYGMNAPSWSLSNEAFFYLLFPLLVPLLMRMSARISKAVVLALPAVVLVGSIVYSMLSTTPDLLYVNPAWRLLGFVSGAALARLLISRPLHPPPLPLALALTAGALVVVPASAHVAEGAFGFSIATKAVYDAVMLPLFLILIASAVTGDLTARRGWITRPALIRLGEWSFALYLTHWLLIDLVVGLLPEVRQSHGVAALLANVVVIGLAVAASGILFTRVERPLERLLRGARPRPEETLAPRPRAE